MQIRSGVFTSTTATPPPPPRASVFPHLEGGVEQLLSGQLGAVAGGRLVRHVHVAQLVLRAGPGRQEVDSQAAVCQRAEREVLRGARREGAERAAQLVQRLPHLGPRALLPAHGGPAGGERGREGVSCLRIVCRISAHKCCWLLMPFLWGGSHLVICLKCLLNITAGVISGEVKTQVIAATAAIFWVSRK